MVFMSSPPVLRLERREETSLHADVCPLLNTSVMLLCGRILRRAAQQCILIVQMVTMIVQMS